MYPTNLAISAVLVCYACKHTRIQKYLWSQHWQKTCEQQRSSKMLTGFMFHRKPESRRVQFCGMAIWDVQPWRWVNFAEHVWNDLKIGIGKFVLFRTWMLAIHVIYKIVQRCWKAPGESCLVGLCKDVLKTWHGQKRIASHNCTI